MFRILCWVGLALATSVARADDTGLLDAGSAAGTSADTTVDTVLGAELEDVDRIQLEPIPVPIPTSISAPDASSDTSAEDAFSRDATGDTGPDEEPDTSTSVIAPTPTPVLPMPPPRSPRLSSGDAIKAIFGLVLLLALAYIGGHPRVQRLEQKLRISQVITAGFPFVLIGLVSREDGLGILSEPVLDAIRPVLPLGLGWLGFAVGFRFDVRKLEKMPPLAGEAFVATTAVPYLVIVGCITALLFAIHDGAPTTSTTLGTATDADSSLLILRDAFVLAAAGAMTAVGLPRLLERHGAARPDVDRVGRIIQLEELAALLGILIIGAFFRPDEVGTGWQLPSVGWVFVTFGIGTALSGVIYALLGTIKGPVETLIIMLGSICFTAGMASYLRLSPVVVCFIAGAVLQNFPGPWKAQVGAALARIERPVYLLFLLIAGAVWRVDEWQGWVLMLAFVAARLLGRIAGVALFARRHPASLSAFERRHLAISPMGALSLAIIVTAQDLYSGPTVPWMVNAVIGGAILTEIIVQVFAFERPRTSPRGPRTRPTQRSMPAFVLEHAEPPLDISEPRSHREHHE